MRMDSTENRFVAEVNSSCLERLVGYNSKRVSFVVMNAVTSKIQKFGLQNPVDYSVLALISQNPGITSRQLCHVLAIYPANMVSVVKGFEEKGLLERRVLPSDGRAYGLYLTMKGFDLYSNAEACVTEVDVEVTSALSEIERMHLNVLLRKIYYSETPPSSLN